MMRAHLLKKLKTLLHDKTIDQDTYALLKKLLETLTRRLERENTHVWRAAFQYVRTIPRNNPQGTSEGGVFSPMG